MLAVVHAASSRVDIRLYPHCARSDKIFSEILGDLKAKMKDLSEIVLVDQSLNPPLIAYVSSEITNVSFLPIRSVTPALTPHPIHLP